MTTTQTETPELLHVSQGQTLKQSKITTTIRLDRELKRRVDEYIREKGMDFTTLCHIALMNAMRYGIHIPPMEDFDEKVKSIPI